MSAIEDSRPAVVIKLRRVIFNAPSAMQWRFDKDIEPYLFAQMKVALANCRPPSSDFFTV